MRLLALLCASIRTRFRVVDSRLPARGGELVRIAAGRLFVTPCAGANERRESLAPRSHGCVRLPRRIRCGCEPTLSSERNLMLIRWKPTRDFMCSGGGGRRQARCARSVDQSTRHWGMRETRSQMPRRRSIRGRRHLGAPAQWHLLEHVELRSIRWCIALAATKLGRARETLVVRRRGDCELGGPLGWCGRQEEMRRVRTVFAIGRCSMSKRARGADRCDTALKAQVPGGLFHVVNGARTVCRGVRASRAVDRRVYRQEHGQQSHPGFQVHSGGTIHFPLIGAPGRGPKIRPLDGFTSPKQRYCAFEAAALSLIAWSADGWCCDHRDGSDHGSASRVWAARGLQTLGAATATASITGELRVSGRRGARLCLVSRAFRAKRLSDATVQQCERGRCVCRGFAASAGRTMCAGAAMRHA